MNGHNAFRFLQAGDLKLGLVPFGISDVPEETREQLLDAPYQAVKRVFDAAIEHQVDFVLLVGELVTNTTIDGSIGSRAATFLLQHFERLNHEGVEIYLSGDTVLPAWCTLPANVHRVEDNSAAFTASTRANQYAATVHSAASAGETVPGARGFDILVMGREQRSLAIPATVDFVAAIGSESAGQPSAQVGSGDGRIWCSGTPQGRHLNSGNQHGCLIVNVEESRAVDVRFVNTAPIGWAIEHIAVPASHDVAADVATIARRIDDRIAEISRHSEHDCVLVDWVLDFEGSVHGQLIRDSNIDHLLQQTRRSTGSLRTRVETVGVRVNESQAMSVLGETERVVLSDFVQLAGRTHRFDAGQDELKRLPWLAGELTDADPSIESRVIRYGYDLLG